MKKRKKIISRHKSKDNTKILSVIILVFFILIILIGIIKVTYKNTYQNPIKNQGTLADIGVFNDNGGDNSKVDIALDGNLYNIEFISSEYIQYGPTSSLDRANIKINNNELDMSTAQHSGPYLYYDSPAAPDINFILSNTYNDSDYYNATIMIGFNKTLSSDGMFNVSFDIDGHNYYIELMNADYNSATILLRDENGDDQRQINKYTGNGISLYSFYGRSILIGIKRPGFTNFKYYADVYVFYQKNFSRSVNQIINCIDSDGGKNYNVKGNTSGPNVPNAIEDFCMNSIDYGDRVFAGNYVAEHFCNSNGNVDSYPYLCPNGCSDGACIESNTTSTCIDTDGGKNYYVSGEIRNSSNQVLAQDECHPIGPSVAWILTEYFCYQNGSYGFDIINCPSKACYAGACINNPTSNYNYFVSYDNTAPKTDVLLAIKIQNDLRSWSKGYNYSLIDNLAQKSVDLTKSCAIYVYNGNTVVIKGDDSDELLVASTDASNMISDIPLRVKIITPSQVINHDVKDTINSIFPESNKTCKFIDNVFCNGDGNLQHSKTCNGREISGSAWMEYCPEGLCVDGACAKGNGSLPPSINLTKFSDIYINGKKIILERLSQAKWLIKYDNKTIQVSLDLENESSNLYVVTSAGWKKQVSFLPELPQLREISNKINMDNINDVEILEKDGDAVYSISGIKRTRVFFIFPVKANINQKINIETKEVIETNKPWWSFLASGL